MTDGVSFAPGAGEWRVTMTWETACMSPTNCSPDNLLMMLLPHHTEVLQSSTAAGQYGCRHRAGGFNFSSLRRSC